MSIESATLRIALLAGGVSRQAPESRSRSQVEAASNIDVDLLHGSSRRNGSRHLAVLTGVSTSYDHWITRCQTASGDDVLVNTDSNGGVRVYKTDTCAAQTVADITSPTTNLFGFSTTYLSSGSPSRHPLCVVGDDIVLANPTVSAGVTRSPQVTTSGFRDTYDALEPFTGTAGGVYAAKATGTSRTAGLYRYIPGIGTFATAAMTAYVGGSAASETALLNGAAQNPRGFKLFYSKYANDSNITYSTTTVNGTTVGVLSGFPAGISAYTFVAGDQVYVGDGAGGVTDGAYAIRSVSGTTVTLETTIGGAGATVPVRGIGRLVEITENFYTNPVDTMDAAAVRYTKALRNAGLTNACVHWEWTNLAAYTGKFVITAGDGGPVSGFSNASYTVFAPTASGVIDDTAVNRAFNAPTVTAGTGAYESFTTLPRDRWVPVPVPDQADALPDKNKMPVRLRKVDTSGGYAATAISLGAWHYFGLGDAVSNDTAKDSAKHSLGAYTNFAGRALATGLVTGSTSSATTFDGADDHVAATTWWALGNQERVTIEFLCKTTYAGATEQVLLHLRQDNDIMVTHVYSGGTSIIRIYSSNGRTDVTCANFNDGNTKHVVVTLTAQAAGLYLNGVSMAFFASVSTALDGSNPGVGSEQGGYAINIGRRIDNTLPFLGTLDEVAVYPFAFSSTLASYRYSQSLNTATTDLWVVEYVPWVGRLSGDSASNPLPNLLKNESAIFSLAQWESRFDLGGERFVLMSRVNDPYNLFVADFEQVTDADPIERPCGSNKTARILHLAPYRHVMVAFTSQGEQYEVGFSGDALTAAGSTVDLSTAYDTLDTPPVRMGSRLYFAARDGSGTQLIEYIIDDASVAGFAELVGQHVEGYVTSTDVILCPAPNDGVVTLVGRNSATRWRYATAYVGGEPRLRGWSDATASADEVLAACQVDGDVFMIVRRGTDYALEAVQVAYEVPGSWTYQPRMDGRVSATGVHAAGTTTWAVPAGVTASGITHAVKSDGTTIPVTIGGSNATASGNYAGAAVLGRAFTHTLTLSRLFLRDANDAPFPSIGLRVRQVAVRLKDTMYAALSWTLGPRAARTKTKTFTSPSSGAMETWVAGDSDRVTVSFTATDPRPFSVGAAEILFDAIPERQ